MGAAKRKVANRIDRGAVYQHFEMQMRSGLAAGAANIGNRLARQHQIALVHEDA